MDDLQVFDPEPSNSAFENYSHFNGATHWLASDLMKILGYDKFSDFRKPITKAQKVCLTLNIPIEENFIHIPGTHGEKDVKLSRFACYLIAMNADIKKPQVAQAQVYFAAMAESVRQYLEHVEGVVRVELRGEISERERSLAGIVKNAGVEQYPLFQNAGYRGMYNMNLYQLRQLKGVPDDRSPLDYMGKTELAANLFRITQTEEKIKAEDIHGQRRLEATAEHVGKEVRNTMRRLSGRYPEELPPSDDIKTVQKRIKQTHRQFRKLDIKPKDKGKKTE